MGPSPSSNISNCDSQGNKKSRLSSKTAERYYQSAINFLFSSPKLLPHLDFYYNLFFFLGLPVIIIDVPKNFF